MIVLCRPSILKPSGRPGRVTFVVDLGYMSPLGSWHHRIVIAALGKTKSTYRDVIMVVVYMIQYVTTCVIKCAIPRIDVQRFLEVY
jgi:hypothetical protein